MASPTNKREGMQMRNPELACDWCGDEVANGEGVTVDDDRVCSECAAQEVQRHERLNSNGNKEEANG